MLERVDMQRSGAEGHILEMPTSKSSEPIPTDTSATDRSLMHHEPASLHARAANVLRLPFELPQLQSRFGMLGFVLTPGMYDPGSPGPTPSQWYPPILEVKSAILVTVVVSGRSWSSVSTFSFTRIDK